MKNLIEKSKSYKAPARRIQPSEFPLFENRTVLDIVQKQPELLHDKPLYKLTWGEGNVSYAVRFGDLLIGVTPKTRDIIKGNDANKLLSLVFRTGTGTSGNQYIRLQPAGANYVSDDVDAPADATVTVEGAS
jgi:hypothetical protein